MSKKKEKKRGDARARRSERRFVPVASTNPWIVRLLGALAALALGAGVYAYFYGQSFADDERLAKLPAYLIAAGAILMGAVIWLGTSSESPVRVGDPGIALEKGELRRMPWWAIEKISWQSAQLALVVSGEDETGKAWTLRVPLAAHPDAVGWILEQAGERVPRVIDIAGDVLEKMPGAGEHAGQKLDLEPLQVVGKKCAKTGKPISYEPDARVCTRCERVYFKRSVPNKCACGASLAHLRRGVVTDAGADSDEGGESGEVAETTTDSTKERAAEGAET